jgi:hypothetical protein
MTTLSDDGSLVFMAEVTRDNHVTNRAVRKWLKPESFRRKTGTCMAASSGFAAV